MSEFWVSEDIADNWLVLDFDAFKREVENSGGTWNLDGYCKSFIDNSKIKLPLVYVDKQGKIFFNEAAKKWERPDELELRLIEIWIRDMDRKPFVILLSRSLKELAEIAPDTLVSSIKGEGLKKSMK